MADTVVEGTLEHQVSPSVTVDATADNQGNLTGEIDLNVGNKTTIEISDTANSGVVTGEVIYDINENTSVELTKDNRGNTAVEVVQKI